MPLIPVSEFIPGIYTEASDRKAIRRYKAGKNVRFEKGWPTKIKGWGKALSDTTLHVTGVARAILSWLALDLSDYVAIGTHLKLYLLHSGAYYDITPIIATGTLAANPFATTNLSSMVTVTHVAHGLTSGQTVIFTGAAVVATLDMNATWIVDSITDVDHYTFTHTGVANATVAAGGGAAVAYSYELSPGLVDAVSGGGWGAGTWGTGTWGTPRTAIQQLRTWSLSNWGQDLIANPYRGAIYVWQKSLGTGVRATLITNAPALNLFAKVSEKDRHLVSFGSYDAVLGAIDPMLISWCSSEDYTDWTATPTNSAGDKRLDNGTTIVCPLAARGGFVILTDKTIYTMVFSGDQFVFNFDTQGQSVGGISPNCAIDIDGTVFYMGAGQFQKFDGQTATLDCHVLSFVFTVDATKGFLGLNFSQKNKIFGARNKNRQEVIWFYCSNGSTEIDRCVAYCYEVGNEHWWLGDVSRTCYVDENILFEEPIAMSAAGYLYVHETTVNDDGAALAYSLETYDFELGQGDMVMRITRTIPDFKNIAGSHTLTLKGRKKPNDDQFTKGPYPFKASSTVIGSKIRARQIAMLIEGTAVDCDIKMGGWRMDAEPVSEN